MPWFFRRQDQRVSSRTSSMKKSRSRRCPAVDIERLEQRTALTVSPPTVGWTPASDSGSNKQDLITNVVQPVFVGRAERGTRVTVAEAQRVIGIATTNAAGVWRLATPAARAFTANGLHTVTARASNPAHETSTATSFSFTIDRTKPTASMSYDPTTGGLTVRFSEPVVGVSLSRMLLRIPPLGTYALDSTATRNLIGPVVMSPTTAGATSYSFTPVSKIVAPGTYTVYLVTNGITDISGNPVAGGASCVFRI